MFSSNEPMYDELGGYDPEDFLPVVYVQNWADAQRYKDFLADHDIPALIGTGEEKNLPGVEEAPGIPVLVPDEMMDQASQVVAGCDVGQEFEPDPDEFGLAGPEDPDPGLRPQRGPEEDPLQGPESQPGLFDETDEDGQGDDDLDESEGES